MTNEASLQFTDTISVAILDQRSQAKKQEKSMRQSQTGYILASFMALALFIVAGCAPQPVRVTADESAVATVNGEKIPEPVFKEYYQQRLKQLAAEGDASKVHEIVLTEMINRTLFAQAALANKIDQQQDVQAEISRQEDKVRSQAGNQTEQEQQASLFIARQSVLIRGELRQYFQINPITEQMVKANTISNEYLVRHIAVKDEKTAYSIIAQLQKGASFAEIAKKSSIVASGKKGGLLGWVSQEDPVNLSLFSAIATLKKGQIPVSPVASQNAWNVFQVDDVRVHTVKSPEKLAKDVRAWMMEVEIDKYLLRLREKARINVNPYEANAASYSSAYAPKGSSQSAREEIAKRLMLDIDAGVSGDCQQRSFGKTEQMPKPEINGVFTRVWQERWYLNRCGRTVSYTVIFAQEYDLSGGRTEVRVQPENEQTPEIVYIKNVANRNHCELIGEPRKTDKPGSSHRFYDVPCLEGVMHFECGPVLGNSSREACWRN